MVLMKSPPAILLHNIQLPIDVTINERDVCDLEMLLMGAFAPLDRYLNFNDFCSVVNNARLSSGDVWPIPIVLPVPKSQITTSENPLEKQQVIKLRDCFGTILAEVSVIDCYEPKIDLMCKGFLGTTDPNHPYVSYLQTNHDNCVYVGGKVKPVHPVLHFDFNELRKTPEEVKQQIKEKQWEVVVGFQTRNPMHRSHFEITLQALREASEMSGGRKAHLLLTPACGPTQPGDIKYHVRVRCYKKILPFYADIGHADAGLVLLPLAMRMAGPREACWHALIRKNFGCTHFIVGRDHAGPSTRKSDGTPFYGLYEAHEFLKSIQSEIGIVPVFGRDMLYLGEEHGGYVQEGSKIPHDVKPQQISGSKFRSMLENRNPVPEWYSFKPIVEELQTFYHKRSEQGFCLYFTGLPCSGKSTLATAVEAALQERENERRQVTVLDADIIRTHLSKGLGFSREDRQCNVRRIGYVASVVVQHGGICIVANIAPYEEDRQFNRRLVSRMGGEYIEVYVSTPLEICEGRDVKEFYKRARAGIIKQFTGISAPYETPSNPELIIDSSNDVQGKVKQVMNFLEANGWIC